MSRPLSVIVLAAGLGKRTRVSLPKVLLPLCGRTVLATVLDAVAPLGATTVVVVVGHGKQRVEQSLAGRAVVFADQGEPRGTGHAVQVAMRQLTGFADGDVLVVNGDCPLITTPSLAQLRAERGTAAAAVLTAAADDPTGLGRVLRNDDGSVRAIREQKDCTPAEAEVDEINAGCYCFDAAALRAALPALTDRNAQRELYLTDVIEQFVAAGRGVVAVPVGDPDEAQGINSLAELALAREVMQQRILLEHLDRGVLIEDPASTYIEHGATIAADARILPFTVIRSGARIGAHCEVGPFAHLRAGADLHEHSEIGNFVEVKNTVVGARTKAKHLTYLGDATIGADANIGAGTITANYDGKHKHRTELADRVFVGSGTVFVAPAKAGVGAATGAGAIVTRNSEIPPGDVWVGMPARSLRRRKDADAGRGAKS